MKLKVGDRVRLGAENRSVSATVKVVSRNQRSIILTFEAILGGWPGEMAAFYENEKWKAIDGMAITIMTELQ